MSLPERKKSAGEIAKLRESFGIPGAPGNPNSPAESAAPSPPPVIAAEEPPAPAEIREPKPVRSLKRAERIPVLPVDGHGEVLMLDLEPEVAPLPAAVPLPAGTPHRQVRSLRKSEQAPLPAVHEPAADSKLPAHRRSGRELNDLRRRAALTNGPPAGPPRPLTAHPLLSAPAYVFLIMAAVGFHYYDLPLAFPVSLVAATLLIAVFILIRRPLSRHHPAFLAALALFVIVFGALHYFPNLQHGP